jgi:hypothetical protein
VVAAQAVIKEALGVGGGANNGTSQDTYTISFHAADAATGKLTAQDYFTLQVD